jgi:hypothetical protein
MMEKVSQGHKLGNLIDYLKEGGEVTIDGRTYVWLHNHVTQVIGDTVYGIDGLAIKGVCISNGEEKPHYMGQTDMPLSYLLTLVNQITEEQWVGICASLVLQEMKKERV